MKALDSKSSEQETVPWVRIPPLPPPDQAPLSKRGGFELQFDCPREAQVVGEATLAESGVAGIIPPVPPFESLSNTGEAKGT